MKTKARKLLLILTALVVCALLVVISWNGYRRYRRAQLEQLDQAAQSGDVASARSLLDAGTPPDDGNAARSPALMDAALNSHLEIVQLLLQRGANPHARDKNGNTLLDAALQQDNGTPTGSGRNVTKKPNPQQHDLALLLLQRGIESRADRQSEDLSMAIVNGWTDIVRSLLDRGADVNPASGRDSAPPLETAIWATETDHATGADHIEIARLLLDRGANVNGNGSIGDTPLMAACAVNNPAAVALLLQKGADINARDKEGDAPLMYAADFGSPALVALLLSRGAKLNVKNDYGETPLITAAGRTNAPVVSMLLQKGLDPNVVPMHGKTALMVVLQKMSAFGYSSPINGQKVALDLLAHGAKADMTDHKGQPILLQAANTNADIVSALMAHGAKVNRADPQGVTPLMAAAQYHREDIIHTLLQHGADVHARDSQGRTALMYAMDTHASHLRLPSVSALLAAGAAVNDKDTHGRTVLVYALLAADTDVVKALVARGVDVNVPGDRSEMPLQIALRGKETRIADILQKAGAKP